MGCSGYFPPFSHCAMGASSLQSVIQIPRALASLSSVDYEQSKIAVPRNLGDQFSSLVINKMPRRSPRKLGDQFSSLVVNKMPRRSFMQFIGFSPISLNVYPVLAAQMLEMKEPEVIRTQKLASGVRIQDIVEGEGPEAREGNLVEVNYVCRRSNGYFVHSTVDQFSGESTPVVLPLNKNQIIEGLKEVLVGMKVGGKSRALIPPSLGYTNENLRPIPDEFGPRRSLLSHANEPLIFEVQLLKVL